MNNSIWGTLLPIIGIILIIGSKRIVKWMNVSRFKLSEVFMLWLVRAIGIIGIICGMIGMNIAIWGLLGLIIGIILIIRSKRIVKWMNVSRFNLSEIVMLRLVRVIGIIAMILGTLGILFMTVYNLFVILSIIMFSLSGC